MKTVWLHLIFYHRNRLEINTYMINDYVISIELTCLSKQSLSAMCSQWYLRNTNTTDYETRTVRHRQIWFHWITSFSQIIIGVIMSVYVSVLHSFRWKACPTRHQHMWLCSINTFSQKIYQLRHVCVSAS
jgi:hypothetical protein